MSYNFLSNINNFTDFNDPSKAYQNVDIDEEINFLDIDEIPHDATFVMFRADKSNDLLIQLLPWQSGVYIPADEMWSIESLNNIQGFKLKKAFDSNTSQELTSGKIQWMIGYK